jgi:hypothetical protein
MSVQEIPPDYSAELREEVENSRMNSDVPLIEGEVGRVNGASINTRSGSVMSAKQRLLLAAATVGLSTASARAADSDWFEPVDCEPCQSGESGEVGIRMRFSKKGSHKQNRRKALKKRSRHSR